MLKALLAVVFSVLAAAGLVLALRSNLESGLVAAPAAALPAASSTTLAGTIEYYPDNTGREVPYLVYRQGSAVSTKALVFDASSACATNSGSYPCALIADALPAYFGAGPVRAEGALDATSLLVWELSPA